MIKILLIEDDEDDVILLKATLAESDLEDYYLEWKSDYDEARKTINEEHFDVFLIDYNLGKKTGLDLMREVRAGDRMIPFILLTGVSIQKREQEALELGAYDFLVKGNITSDLIARSIRYAMKHSSTLTDLKKSEKEKFGLLEQQFTVQKSQALGTLVGGVAHDFNNILGGMIAATELLNIKLENNEELKNYSDSILTLGIRGKSVVQKLLTYIREQDTKTSVNDVNPIINEVVDMVKSMTSAIINIEYYPSKEPVFVHCDSTQIHQVIANIVINATQAIEESGNVDVVIDPVFIEGGFARESQWLNQHAMFHKVDAKVVDGAIQPQLKIGLLEQGEYVRISIKDSGKGMDIDTIARITDPFYTTKQKAGGTGLGLATSRGIITALKGGMTVTSETDNFSKFEIYFPRVTDAIQFDNIDKVIEENKKVRERVLGKRILLLDDEEVLGNMFAEFLSINDYDVIPVTSPDIAISMIETEPDGWDLIITDENMPQMRGINFIKGVRQINQDIPCIVWTGKPIDNFSEIQESLNIKEMLVKPVDFNVLLKTLTDIFDYKSAN